MADRAIAHPDTAALVEAVDRVRQMSPEQVKAAILACLSGQYDDFGTALGLPPDWRRIRTIELRAERDGVLRELAERLLPDGTVTDQEILVRAELRRFQRRWLRRDRYLSETPAEYFGKPDEMLFQAFRLAEKLGAAIPMGRQLRGIIEKPLLL